MTVAQLRACMAAADGASAEHERDLVERANRDPEAFAVLYRQHYRTLADYVFRRTGDRHVTEDLVAEVFLTALRTLPRFRYRGVPVRFWLLRIATNTVNHWVRHKQRFRRHLAGLSRLFETRVADAAASASSAHDKGDRELARRALLSLSPKHQAVLSLHYLEGLAVKEVAAVIGCRVGTVKSRLARARDALRAELNGRR